MQGLAQSLACQLGEVILIFDDENPGSRARVDAAARTINAVVMSLARRISSPGTNSP